MLQTDDAVVINPAPAPTAGRRRQWPTFALAVVPFLLLALWRGSLGIGAESDDSGQYLMHAQAIAEGRPYGDIGYIYSRYSPWIGPRLALPGLPLTLAPFLAAFGANMVILKLLMLAFSFGFVVFAGLYFARYVDWKLGLGVALLVGLSPAVIINAGEILTDLPFAALVWLIIYIIEQPGRFSWKRIAAVTALGAYAVAFRPTGVALAPALVLYALLHWKRHRWRPLVPVLVWGAGLLLLSLVMQLGAASVISIHPSALFEWVFVERLPLYNLRYYAEALVASHTYPFRSDTVNDAFHAITVVLMVIGLAVWARRHYRRFVVVFAAFYSLALLLLPLAQPRYIWPLFPLFVFGMLKGVKMLVERLTARSEWGYNAALIFAVALVPGVALQSVREPARPSLNDTVEVRELFGYLQYTHRVQPMRVVFYKPRTLSWQTGIPAMGPPRGEPLCMMGELGRREITHLIAGRVNSTGSGSVRRMIAEYPDRFEETFANRVFTVYAFRPGPEQSALESNPACPR